jgi:hypothetical protein
MHANTGGNKLRGWFLNGQPLMSMITTDQNGKSWLAYREPRQSNPNNLWTFKAATINIFSKSAKIYLNDGDSVPDFQIKGDTLGHTYNVFDVRGGQKKTAAIIHRKGILSLEGITVSLTKGDRYKIVVEPGYDAAFMGTVGTLVDEIFHDKSETR